jgi:hypothetical protein
MEARRWRPIGCARTALRFVLQRVREVDILRR